ncbi:cation transporter [candidate division KSB1 bacterium]|nr:cation transporter [candidate division KSB1 bacterium]
MPQINKADQKIRSITLWGVAVNIGLSIIKIIAGSLVYSVGLLADGIHSLSDLITDIAVLVSSRAARRPPDENHQYGHGKFETFGSIIIGIVLIIVGVGIGWSAIKALILQQENYPGVSVVIVASISVIAKEMLFRATRNVAIETHSTSLYANAWHHRSDALSSLAVILGGVGSLFGFGFSDHIAGLFVGVMIVAVAIKILNEGLMELSEHSLDSETITIIQSILEEYDGVNHWHKLRTRKIGAELFVDVHIHVNPMLTVEESHGMTKEIEHLIQTKIKMPVNTLIHVEPFSYR